MPPRSEAPPHPSFSSSSSSPFSLLPFLLRTRLPLSQPRGAPGPLSVPLLPGVSPSSRFLRRLGPGSCSSSRGLQRELPRHLRGRAAAARASCEVRWEEAAWEPRGVDATEAREPRQQVSVRDSGRGGARVHAALPLGLVSESGSAARAAAPPTPAARPAVPVPHPHLPWCQALEGPAAPSAHPAGGRAKHKGTAEDPWALLVICKGQQASKRGSACPCLGQGNKGS